MNVMEIYRSVQGEGTLMGVPTTFVRFFACNLRCSWCDTKYSWSVRDGGTWDVLSPEQVADQVDALGARHVVLTGGEPMLQRDLAQLSQLLRSSGHHLTIETNTTVFPESLVSLINLWSLSPKLTSAGEGYLRYPIIERFLLALRSEKQQWKFVVRDEADEAGLRICLERYPRFVERQLPIGGRCGDCGLPGRAGAPGRACARPVLGSLLCAYVAADARDRLGAAALGMDDD